MPIIKLMCKNCGYVFEKRVSEEDARRPIARGVIVCPKCRGSAERVEEEGGG
jgi:rubredoxin